MDTETLRTEIRLELDKIERVVRELEQLAQDVAGQATTVRERTVAGAFLAQFYMGVENVLKRIVRYYHLDVPESDRWHAELFNRFCAPSSDPLPVLFDEELAQRLRPYRRFRHVVQHGYGFDLNWTLMAHGVHEARSVFEAFKASTLRYLARL